ncbi:MULTISPECIES: hypothetical protein [Streptomyces]|uniref:Uncharacterized protein n=1 Tax=Streptomyces rhizosphaericus TaxID=114699 RepID=A0A6G4ADW3_9ACTN|nr:MULTISPECIES: hypothetical protein [Streptomyces]MBA6441508.1 hypothetical protein [Streptomyces sp. GMR22]MBI0377143.1 hypothetical protein [Streptomyces albiflaviniger]NEW70677.1 hypothetical protein [Streptomyces rhizosphaericus]
MQYKFRHVCPKSVVCTEAVCVRADDASDGSCGSGVRPDVPGADERHTVCGAR